MRHLALLGIAALALLPNVACAQRRVGVVVRPVPYGGYSGYGPAYAPYPYGRAYYDDHNSGKLKIDTNVRDAEVLIDGAYAGVAGKLKTMWLRAGAHTLELRAPGRTRYSERIFIVAGKTLHIAPGLRVE